MEDLEEELGLTQEQLKAAKAVYRAIKKAGKLGVSFWDNNGTLQAFNSNKINLPVPMENEYSLNDVDPTYYELLHGYFYSGNADDPLFFNRV